MSTEVSHRAYREWELVLLPGKTASIMYGVTYGPYGSLAQAFTDRWVWFDGSPETFFFEVGPDQFPVFGVPTGLPVSVTIDDQHARRIDRYDVRRVVTWRNNGTSAVKIQPHVMVAPPWD
jgi:hypothetical protein